MNEYTESEIVSPEFEELHYAVCRIADLAGEPHPRLVCPLPDQLRLLSRALIRIEDRAHAAGVHDIEHDLSSCDYYVQLLRAVLIQLSDEPLD